MARGEFKPRGYAANPGRASAHYPPLFEPPPAPLPRPEVPQQNRLLASPPAGKHGSFYLFLQALTSRASLGSQLTPSSTPLGCHSGKCPRSHPPPSWAGSPRSAVSSGVLGPGAPAPLCPALVPTACRAESFSLNRLLLSSQQQALIQLPLLLSSPPPTRLPHSALGPSPWPQEVCLSIVLRFQH